MRVPRIEQQWDKLYPELDVDTPFVIEQTNAKNDKIAKGGVKERANAVRPRQEFFNDIVALPQAVKPQFASEYERIGFHSAGIPRDPETRTRMPIPLFPAHILRDDPGASMGRDTLALCEYDMDEQDAAFLGFLTTEFGTVIPAAAFEFAMSVIELEMFKIELAYPLEPLSVPDEVQACEVCGDTEGQNLNAIIFCDGCDLAVHQDCYGVPFIPDGQWLCRPCQVRRAEPLSCRFCPVVEGPLKPLENETGWAHVLCGIWIPELSFGNITLMEPIQDAATIPRDRWRLRCTVCGVSNGACIQCSHGDCSVAFHPTCARAAGLYMKMTPLWVALSNPATLVACCARHSPPGWTGVDVAGGYTAVHAGRAAQKAKWEASTARNEYPYWRTPTGTLLVPAKVSRLLPQYLSRRFGVEISCQVSSRICRYWLLKREKSLLPFSRRLRSLLDTSRHEELTARQQLPVLNIRKQQLEAIIALLDEFNETCVSSGESSEVELAQELAQALTPPQSPEYTKPASCPASRQTSTRATKTKPTSKRKRSSEKEPPRSLRRSQRRGR